MLSGFCPLQLQARTTTLEAIDNWTLPCAGDIIQQGVNKVAVYKDENGKAQGFKAACPHLVCSQLFTIFLQLDVYLFL